MKTELVKYLNNLKCEELMHICTLSVLVSNRSPYRIQCNSNSNRSPYRIVTLTSLILQFSL